MSKNLISLESKSQNVNMCKEATSPSLGSGGSKNTFVVFVKKAENSNVLRVVPQESNVQQQHKNCEWKKSENISTGSKRKSRPKVPLGDHLKLNLNLGFEKYDSSNLAANVFKDDEDDEGFHDRSKPELQCTRIKIPHVKHIHVPHTDTIGNTPFLSSNGQFLFKSPIATSIQQSTSLSNVTPVSRFDLSGSSGYHSANSSVLKDTYDTPSSLSLPLKHPTARQIFHTSPPSNCNSGHNLKQKSVLMSSPNSRPSPVSSLATNLKNVTVFQSSYSFNNPSQSALTSASCTSIPNTSTPKSSGIVVHSASGHRFVLPTTPQQTKTVTVSKSDSHIDIQPIDFSQLVGKVHIKKEIIDTDQVPDSFCNINQNKIKPGSKSRDVYVHINVKEPRSAVSLSSVENAHEDENNSQESVTSSQGSDKDHSDALNDSLTNIQWLGGMQLKKDEEKSDGNFTHMKKDTPIQWRCLSHAEVLKIAEEYGKAKRPPFSYMTLIQMALNSREDKRMTLREICKWIEETFPYYKHTAKPGWKNSIRHNLSLYSIFEREKSKKHGSHWTIREDCPEKIKVVPVRDKKDAAGQMPSLFPVTFIPHQTPTLPKIALPHSVGLTPNTASFTTQDNKRKGLQPILPRPQPLSTPLQTYALIPIQNLPQGSSSQGQPMLIQVPTSSQFVGQPVKQEAGMTDVTGETDSVESHHDKKKKKVINIAPKISSPNIVRQAWLDAQTAFSDSDSGKTSSKKIKTDENHRSACGNEIKVKKSKPIDRLPKPKLYTKKTPPCKKSKTRRKQKLVPKERDLMQDSSDEETDFATKLEKDLPTPIRNLLDSAENDNQGGNSISTSTPLKSPNFSSPQLLSPIQGLTPLRNSNILDNSFLDCLKDVELKVSSGSPNLLSSSRKLLATQMQSPNGQAFDVLFSGLTPIKMENEQDSSTSGNTHNLSKYFSDFPLYAQMIDEEIGSPVSLNWSAMCQQLTATENEDG